jgi:hypothetical protein
MSAASLQLPDGRTLTVSSKEIETTSYLPRPDSGWSFTDAHGHEHQAVSEDDNSVDYPTLRWVVDEKDYVVDEDGYPEEYPGSGHWECVTCGEHITPSTIGPSPWREFTPGPRSYYLDGQPISAEEARALHNPGA